MNCKQHFGVQPYPENVMLRGLLGTGAQEYVVREKLLHLPPPHCMDETTVTVTEEEKSSP